MKKVKKMRFTHVVFAVAFAIGICVFSTPAVAQYDIAAAVPVHLRNVHPDVGECYMVLNLGTRKDDGNMLWNAHGVTQLDYDPSGNGSFDGDVVVTVDLRQVYGPGPSTPIPERSGRPSSWAYEDLKAENFTHYRVYFYAVHSSGQGMIMNNRSSTPAWGRVKESDVVQEIVKD